MKKYRLIGSSPEYPIGTIATKRTESDYSKPDMYSVEYDGQFLGGLHEKQIEGNSCWKEITEEEKKCTKCGEWYNGDTITDVSCSNCDYNKLGTEEEEKVACGNHSSDPCNCIMGIKEKDSPCSHLLEEEERKCDCEEDTCNFTRKKDKVDEESQYDTVFYIGYDGRVYPKERRYIQNDGIDTFPTREAAEIELILRKLMVKRWRPSYVGCEYYFWDTKLQSVELSSWEGDAVDIDGLLLGNCFIKNDDGMAQCESYGKEIQKCVDYLLNNET